ncbi:MAG: tetratricopeptide repeat protein [Candidatus Bipolaricaulia bacterium]
MNQGQKLWVTVTLWVVIIGFGAGGVLFFTPGGPQGFFGSNNQQQQEQQQPAIVVNGEEIPTSKLETRHQQTIQRYQRLYSQFGGNFEQRLKGASGAHYRLQLRNEAANQLIRTTLISQKADERGLSVKQTEVDKRFKQQYDRFLKQNKVTEDRLRRLLENNPQVRQRFAQAFNLSTGSISEFKNYLREQARQQLKQQKLQDQVVGKINPTTADLISYVQSNSQQFKSQIVKPVVPSEKELRAYFEKNKDQYGKEEIHARHILIELPQDASDAQVQSAQRQIAQIQKRLEEGADFAEMARQYSDGPSASKGGDLGWFGKGQMVKPFQKAAFKLEKGEISDPVRTKFGLHLIKLEGRRTSSFQDVRDQVRKDYVSSQKDQRFQKWLKSAREKGAFPKQPEVQVQQIQISLPSDPSKEQVQSAERQIQNVYNQLQSDGANFASLAKKHSDGNKASNGGKLGWIGDGASQPKKLKAKAFNLQSGQVSKPFRTDKGFHVIKVSKRRTTDKLKQQVTDAYKQQERQSRFDQWVQEQKDDANIVIKEQLLKAYRLEEKAKNTDDTAKKLDLLDQAIAAYDKASSSGANDPHIGYYQSLLYQNKANILQSQLDNLGEDAAKDKRQSLQKRLDQAKQNAVDAFLASVGNYGKSDDSEFQKIVKLAPKNAELHYYYARFLNNTVGKADRALTQINRALEINPDYVEAHTLAADIRTKQGNYAKAVEHLSSAADLAEQGSSTWRNIRIDLAKTYLDQAESTGKEKPLTKARDVLTNLRDQLSSSDRRLGEVQKLLGDLHMDRQAYEKAISAYEAALEAGVNNPMEAEIQLGEAQLQAGQVEDAVATLEGVVDRSAGQYSAPAHINLGDAYRAQGNTEDALSEYRRALELRASQSTQIEVARKILEVKPSDQDTRFRLAKLYRTAQQHSKAMEQYRKILESSPDNWRAHHGMGRAHLALNQPEQAKNHLKSALLQKPSTSDKISIYQSLLEAARAINGKGSLGEDGKDALVQLASLYLEQGQASQAQQPLKTLQQNYPNYRPDRVAELQSQMETQMSQQGQGSGSSSTSPSGSGQDG